MFGSVDIDLAPGVYWLGLQNDEGTNPAAQWTSFLAQTLGGDVGPTGDPNPAPQNAILNHSSFATGTELGDYIQQGADFSIGAIGATAVPEPATGILLAAGAVVILACSRRLQRSAGRHRHPT